MPSLHTTFSAVRLLFPENKMALKGSRLNDMMIHTKPQNPPAKLKKKRLYTMFQTVASSLGFPYEVCLNESTLKGTTLIRKCFCFKEINSV
jgi:hypothetical protein